MTFEKVNKDAFFQNIRTLNSLKIPIYKNLNAVGDNAGNEGEIILRRDTQEFCYHDGTTWICLSNFATQLRNVGTGAKVYIESSLFPIYDLRTLTGSTFINVNQQSQEIQFNLNLNAENIPVSSQLASVYVENSLQNLQTLQFRKLQSTDGSVIIENLNDTVDFRVDFEENVSGNNLGSTFPTVYVDGTAPNFDFRRLRPLNNSLSITQTTPEYIDFEFQLFNLGASGEGAVIYDDSVSGNPYPFRRIQAGNNITIDDSNPNFIVIDSLSSQSLINVGQYDLSGLYDIYNEPNEIRRLYGTANPSIPLPPTGVPVQLEDTRINDPFTNPNPSVNGNKIGVPPQAELVVYVNSSTGNDANNGLASISSTDDNGPVQTINRAFEILRMRNYTNSAVIQLSSGNYIIDNGRNNWNVGIRGRQLRNTRVVGEETSIISNIGIIDISANPLDGLVSIQLNQSLSQTDTVGKVFQLQNGARYTILQRPFETDPNIASDWITVASTNIGDFSIGTTGSIFGIETQISVSGDEVFLESDQYTIVFENIEFNLESNPNGLIPLTLTFLGFHTRFVNVGFVDSPLSGSLSTIQFRDCYVETAEQNSSKFTGIYSLNSVMNFRYNYQKSSIFIEHSAFASLGTALNSTMDSFNNQNLVINICAFTNTSSSFNIGIESFSPLLVQNTRMSGLNQGFSLSGDVQCIELNIDNTIYTPFSVTDSYFNIRTARGVFQNVSIRGIRGITTTTMNIQNSSLQFNDLYLENCTSGLIVEQSNISLNNNILTQFNTIEENVLDIRDSTFVINLRSPTQNQDFIVNLTPPGNPGIANLLQFVNSDIRIINNGTMNFINTTNNIDTLMRFDNCNCTISNLLQIVANNANTCIGATSSIINMKELFIDPSSAFLNTILNLNTTDLRTEVIQCTLNSSVTGTFLMMNNNNLQINQANLENFTNQAIQLNNVNFEINELTLSNANIGIQLTESKGDLINLNMSNIGSTGLTCTSSSVTLKGNNSIIESCGNSAIIASDSHVSLNGVEGTNLIVRNNIVGSGRGILAENSTLYLQYVTMQNNSASNIDITNCRLYTNVVNLSDSLYGIRGLSSNIHINSAFGLGNVSNIENNQYGIYVENCQLSIERIPNEANIRIVNNTAEGLYTENSLVLVRNVYIEENTPDTRTQDNPIITNIHSKCQFIQESPPNTTDPGLRITRNYMKNIDSEVYIKNHFILYNNIFDPNVGIERYIIVHKTGRLYIQDSVFQSNQDFEDPLIENGIIYFENGVMYSDTNIIQNLAQSVLINGIVINSAKLLLKDDGDIFTDPTFTLGISGFKNGILATNTSIQTTRGDSSGNLPIDIHSNENGLTLQSCTVDISQEAPLASITANNNEYGLVAIKNCNIAGLIDPVSNGLNGGIAPYQVPSSSIAGTIGLGQFAFVNLNVYCVSAGGINQTEPNVILLN